MNPNPAPGRYQRAESHSRAVASITLPRKRPIAALAVAFAVLLSVTACSGGAGSDDADNVSSNVRTLVDEKTSAPTPSPTVEVTVEKVEVTEPIAYTSSNVDDPGMDVGTTRVATIGTNGVKTTVFDVTYEDGVEVSRTAVEERVSTAPVNEVIAVGSKQPVVVAPEPAPATATRTTPAPAFRSPRTWTARAVRATGPPTCRVPCASSEATSTTSTVTAMGSHATSVPRCGWRPRLRQHLSRRFQSMTLTLGPILRSAGVDPIDTQAIRHAFVRQHEGTGLLGIHADSTDNEILKYTSEQSAKQRVFPAVPPPIWVVFVREGGNRARLWSIVENRGEVSNDETVRTFDLAISAHLADLRDRLVIGWRSPRAWRLNGPTAASYPVLEIADAKPIFFPGFDRLVLDYVQLQAMMREHRYASWRTALSSVIGIYLITDTRTGRHYVGKADGAESIRQRWGAYATNGHGGNVELRNIDPTSFRYSLLRVFDPSTPTSSVNEAESHFKVALDTRSHGLNRN